MTATVEPNKAPEALHGGEGYKVLPEPGKPVKVVQTIPSTTPQVSHIAAATQGVKSIDIEIHPIDKTVSFGFFGSLGCVFGCDCDLTCTLQAVLLLSGVFFCVAMHLTVICIVMHTMYLT